jgi:hypothetical protein
MDIDLTKMLEDNEVVPVALMVTEENVFTPS